MRKLNTSLVCISLICAGFIFSCSKKSADTPKPKDNVSIDAFAIDVSNTILFKESFNGNKTSYPDVVLVPDVNTSAVVAFNVSTSPANSATGLMYNVKNDDGTVAAAAAYTVTGNQVKFSAPGAYRISAVVPATATSNASPVSAEVKVQVASNVPDDNLRTELKKINALHFTAEVLDLSSTAGLRRLEFPGMTIKSLAGISRFTDADTLDCTGNQLTTLDLSSMVKLKSLSCGYNNLTLLNVKGTSLGTLNCSSNQLTSLDVQGLTSLAFLDCSANNLTSLNIAGLTNLKSLSFSNNQLSAIDFTGLTGFISIDCSYNQLTSLNVNGFAGLGSLLCMNNKFTTLDVHSLSNLYNLACHSALLTTLTLNTAAGSYPNMNDLRVSAALQCTPGIKQIKIDRGSSVSIRTFSADNMVLNGNFDPIANCP